MDPLPLAQRVMCGFSQGPVVPFPEKAAVDPQTRKQEPCQKALHPSPPAQPQLVFFGSLGQEGRCAAGDPEGAAGRAAETSGPELCSEPLEATIHDKLLGYFC